MLKVVCGKLVYAAFTP
ncbi:hypothetical protein M2F95_21285 [Vibrio vulnificus]|nr:hypothetical protein [Vibrio vulnificus]MCU8102814.1 hypothetical protein [Vibrio vulnificus]MCU8181628.1 hypothetical protein [Vibrio vulnificus]MCU8194896.1 hypothetical protein [Vibrio vulnificus]MCU8225684.1 hypothetical protein [Vibrio vulnificus]MCU8291236.1 hypothetical protein [Vibrio vulnificus]